MRKWFAYIFAVVGILAINASAQAQDKIKLTIAHPPVALHLLPVMVAVDEGYFAKEGLDVQNTFMAGGSAAAAAMMGGSVAAASGAVSRAVLLESKGVNVKLLDGIAGARDWAIVVSAKRHGDVNSIKQLKGLKIGTPRRGSDGEQIVHAILEENNLKVGPDVKLIQINGFQNQMIAFEKGDIDAAIFPEPFVTMGVRKGIIKPVLDLMKGQGPALLRQRIWTGIMVKEDFLKQHPETAAKIVRAMTAATAAIYKDPKMAIAVAAKHMPSVGKDMLEEMIPARLKATNPKAYVSKIGPEAIKAENEWLEKLDTLKKKVAYDDVVATGMEKYW